MVCIHPNSRKAKKIEKDNRRKKRITEKKKKYKNEKMDQIVNRLTWIQLYSPIYMKEEGIQNYTEDNLKKLIQKYVERNDEEILEAEKTGKGSKSFILERKKVREIERKECISGMSVPDLTDEKILKKFNYWDGDYNTIQSWKKIKVRFLLNNPTGV